MQIANGGLHLMPHFSFRNVCCLVAALGILFIEAEAGLAQVPTLEQLAGEWQDAASLRAFPALNNTLGAAQAEQGVLALTNISFPPITMAHDTGALLIDGQVPKPEKVRWFPYQVLRRGTAGDLRIDSAIRMPYEARGILFHVVLTNTAAVSRSFELKIHLSANTSRHDRWGYVIPKDENPHPFSARAVDEGRSLVLDNAQDKLANCFSFVRNPDMLSAQEGSGVAIWHIALPKGASLSFDYALAVGNEEGDVHNLAKDWATHFNTAFEQVQRDWQIRFDAMFKPKNPYFSGHLPTLITTDERLRRVYYMSVVSLLSVYRTGFPVAPRVYVSNSPEYDATMMYFWDTREWATVLALLDPVMLKEYLRSWLSQGIYNGYAEEFLTGTLQGPWYSANDLSIFILLNSYLNVTGDHSFLSERIHGKTVLEHMDSIATHWQKLVRPGRTLADYGDASNLLECVPSYIHEVPSFNAANVWMMRRVAALQAGAGNEARARELRTDADRLLPAVLGLYDPGQGVWDSLHRDGTRVQVRHIFDFATIGLSIAKDLPPKTRQQMTAFVESELLTDHWMRALSLQDSEALQSDRPDHGPMGAFSAWPAETMAVLCEFGEYSQALDFLHRISDVTFEGPFTQARELLGRKPDSPVRIAHRGSQTYNASNGGAFAETILRDFFGYQPDLLTHDLISDVGARGFQGQLLNVRQGDRLYTIRSTNGGIKVTPSAIYAGASAR
jgi:hypothetical protein